MCVRTPVDNTYLIRGAMYSYLALLAISTGIRITHPHLRLRLPLQANDHVDTQH